jgi:hypothetical protein
MNDELGKIWMEAVVVYLKALSLKLRGQRNTAGVPAENRTKYLPNTATLNCFVVDDSYCQLVPYSWATCYLCSKNCVYPQDNRKNARKPETCLQTGPWTITFPTASCEASYLSGRERIYKYISVVKSCTIIAYSHLDIPAWRNAPASRAKVLLKHCFHRCMQIAAHGSC